MSRNTLLLLYDYSDWATKRIFDAAEFLTPAQMAQDGNAGNGSPHQTLLHMLETQAGWFSWFDGSLSPEQAYGLTITVEEAPDVAAMRERWEAIHAQAIGLIEQIADEQLNERWLLGPPGNATPAVPLWQLMLHVANHGTQHRSEVAAMLTGHGHSPGNLDLLFYAIERSTAAS